MFFLTKRLPLANEEDLARALAPLLAYCELLEDRPKPAMLLRRDSGDTILCMRANAEAEARLFEHPKLAIGVRVAWSEDLVGVRTLAIPPRDSFSVMFALLTHELERSGTKSAGAERFSTLVSKKVRSVLKCESRCAGFMRRTCPYRDPIDVLNDWGLSPPKDCNCMRARCEVCLVRRWEMVTTMRKHRTAQPPGGLPKHPCHQFRPPPEGTVFLAAVHPFGWVRNGRFSRASIW